MQYTTFLVFKPEQYRAIQLRWLPKHGCCLRLSLLIIIIIGQMVFFKNLTLKRKTIWGIPFYSRIVLYIRIPIRYLKNYSLYRSMSTVNSKYIPCRDNQIILASSTNHRDVDGLLRECSARRGVRVAYTVAASIHPSLIHPIPYRHNHRGSIVVPGMEWDGIVV